MTLFLPTAKHLADAAEAWSTLPQKTPRERVDIASRWSQADWQIVAGRHGVMAPNWAAIGKAMAELRRRDGDEGDSDGFASDVEILRNALESICTLAREDNSLATDAIHSIAAVALIDTEPS